MKVQSSYSSLPSADFKSSLDPLSSLENELLEKYDPEVVQDVIRQIRRYNLPSLPDSEVKRVRLFCHYYDFEKQIENIVKTSYESKVQRVFNRYMRHARSEVTGLLGHQNKEFTLSIEHLERAKLNYIELLKNLPSLLDQYGERTAHRALNHYSIVTSDVLCGRASFPSYPDLCKKIDAVFSKEKELEQLLDILPFDTLQKHFETLNKEIHTLKDPPFSRGSPP